MNMKTEVTRFEEEGKKLGEKNSRNGGIQGQYKKASGVSGGEKEKER